MTSITSQKASQDVGNGLRDVRLHDPLSQESLHSQDQPKWSIWHACPLIARLSPKNEPKGWSGCEEAIYPHSRTLVIMLAELLI